MVSVVGPPRVLRDLSRASRTTAVLSFPWLSAPRPQHHQHLLLHLPKRRHFHVGHHPHHQNDQRCHDHESHAAQAQTTSGGPREGAGEKSRAAWQNALPGDTVAQNLPDLKRFHVAFVLDGSSDVAAFVAAEFLASTGRIGVTVFAAEGAPHTVHVSGGGLGLALGAGEAGAGHSLNEENRTAGASSPAAVGSTTLGASTDQGAFAHLPFISRLQNKRKSGGTGRSGVSTRFAYLLKTWGERGVYDESSRQLDLRKLLADFRHGFTGASAGKEKDRSEISSTGKSSPTPEQDTTGEETAPPAVVHWGGINCEAGVEGDSDCDDFDWMVYGSAEGANSVSDVVERVRENTTKRFLLWHEGCISVSTAGADAASPGGTVHFRGGKYENSDRQKKVQRACFLFPAANKCEVDPDGGATGVVMDLKQLERRVLVGQASAAKIWALIDKETRKDAQKQVAEEDARAEQLAAAGRAGQSMVDTSTSTRNSTNKSASVLSAAS